MGIREELVELHDDPELLFMDGYDAAIIGVCEQFGRPLVVAYSFDAVIEISMKDGSSYEDALEHFSYNQLGSYMGEHTPVFIHVKDA
jgi:hypothetical protein